MKSKHVSISNKFYFKLIAEQLNVYLRCVTEIECKDKWLHQSSDLDYCTDYGNVLGQGHYSCHFCCTEDGCNSKLVPQKSTWYTKS